MEVTEGSSFKQIFIHPSFYPTIKEINERNINLPIIPVNEQIDFQSSIFPSTDSVLSVVESESVLSLDPELGVNLLQQGIGIAAYDESIDRFDALEGIAFLTAHSLVLHGQNDFIPSIFISFNFYTRSKHLTDDADYIKFSDNPENSRKEDYVSDRANFLVKNVPKNSILFVDGPLIGGQISHYTTKLNEILLNNDIIPIFLIKNSTSNLVTDNLPELTGKFNSDMHWAHKILKNGQRTRFFQYIDRYNNELGKIFCYLKPFNCSPQRIEFHINTYNKYKNKIYGIMNIIQYLLLAQGNLDNPQLRTIAIAEKYARESIKLINLHQLMRRLGVTATINQDRFERE